MTEKRPKFASPKDDPATLVGDQSIIKHPNSCRKNKIYQALLAKNHKDSSFRTSTPRAFKHSSNKIMEIFKRMCNESNPFQVILDNDSGYGSTHHESNIDSSSENVLEDNKDLSSEPVFLSEDALLEKPEICSKLDLSAEIDKEDFEETRRLFNSSHSELEESFESQSNSSKLFTSSDSIVLNSFVSEKSHLSGLDTDFSDASLVIPICEDIIVRLDTLVDTSDSFPDNKQGHDQHVNMETKIEQNTPSQMKEELSISKTESLKLESDEKIEVFPVPLSVKSEPDLCNTTHECNECNDEISALQIKKDKSTISEIDSLKLESDMRIEVFPEPVLQEPLDNKSKPVLSNVTNTCNVGLKMSPHKDKNFKYKSPLKINVEEKENMYNLTQELESPVKRLKTAKKYVPSPDLFSDAEEPEAVNEPPPENKILSEKYALKCDMKLLRKVQNGMSGVLPPPSLTIMNLSVDEILNKMKEGSQYFWCDVEKKECSDANISSSSLNISSESSQKTLLINGTFGSVYKPFPEVLGSRYHGLHHNRSKLSEEFEHLCDKYAQRYVGMETQSTCTVFKTNYLSPKKKLVRKSPGRRLSHLARRRITFSSANLQASSSSFMGARYRQIMIDAKKLELLSRKKSPRKTPKKSPARSPIKTRTPSSSAKKKLMMRFRMVNEEIEETYSNCSSVKSDKSWIQDESSRESGFIMSSMEEQAKRRLFSSGGDILTKKRKRTDAETTQLSKLTKYDMKPTKEEMKSALMSLNKSDTAVKSSQSGDMTEVYKKKLQWTVYEALTSHNINSKHPEFKTFASTLARVIRRFLPTSSFTKPEEIGDKMMKLARMNVFAVIKGKSVDEIISDYMKTKKQQNSQTTSRNTSDSKSSLSSSSSNKENVFRSKSPNSSTRSQPVLKDRVFVNSRLNRIRKAINFGEDNR